MKEGNGCLRDRGLSKIISTREGGKDDGSISGVCAVHGRDMKQNAHLLTSIYLGKTPTQSPVNPLHFDFYE